MNNDRYAPIRLENQLCFPLYACAKEIVRQYRPYLSKLNLTYTQYIVMMALWEKGTISEKELGKMVHLDSGTLAPLLKRLEKNGFITKSRCKEDERAVEISLTKKGDDMKDEALQVPMSMAGCMDISEEEAATLYRLLYKALDSMK